MIELIELNERQKRFGLVLYKTKTGYCVAFSRRFFHLIKQYNEERPFRDDKSWSDKAKKNIKEKIIRRIKIKEAKIMRPGTSVEEYEKWFNVVDFLEAKYSLKPRVGASRAVAKKEILLDLLAPFFFEFRDASIFKDFIKHKLYNGSYESYLAPWTFLRAKNMAVREGTFILASRSLPKSLDFLKKKQDFSKVGLDKGAYVKQYMKINRAYERLRYLREERLSFLKAYERRKRKKSLRENLAQLPKK